MSFALFLASLSFLMVVIWGRPFLKLLKHLKIGKQIRIDGPEGHFNKLGTPTMGGILISLPVLIITVVLNIYNLSGQTLIGRSVLVPLGVMIFFAILGAIDDMAGVRGLRQGEGMTARQKIIIEVIFVFVVVLVMHYGLDLKSIAIPGVPNKIEIGLFYISNRDVYYP